MSRSKRPRAGRPAGVRDIAEAIGVSIGTVDRALHDRPGVRAETRARVLEAARSLGYRPNLAARVLSSSRRLRIAVCFPRTLARFWDLVRDGLLDSARGFESQGVELVLRFFHGLGEGEREAFADALGGDPDGIIMVPGYPERLGDLIDETARRDIPLVYVNTDAPGTARQTVIWVDPHVNGAVVGELMGHFLKGRGRVLPVTGHLSAVEHSRKLEGFSSALGTLWPGIRVAPVVEGLDEERSAYERCRERLSRDRDVDGVYVGTANAPPVLRALEAEGLAGRVTVITTDLYPELAPFIESGTISATIDQRPWLQGQMAFQVMYRLLTEGVQPPESVRLAPHVVMRSNLRLFLERLRSLQEGVLPVSPALVAVAATSAVQSARPLPSTTRT
jgi:LacI family transcriptional regulator